MAIHFQCPNCGSKIVVSEEYAGKTTNCPACWDSVRVSSNSVPRSRGSSGQPADPTASEQMEMPLPRLILLALSLAMKKHSRYFVAGVLVLFILLFLAFGGVGALQRLWDPTRQAAPTKTDANQPSRLWEMRRDLE